jgi:vacuolar-type H+-ATPase subunit F/Vma7
MIAAIGTASRVNGWCLAGALVRPAETSEEVLEAFRGLPQEVSVLVLTRAAHAALADVTDGRLQVVMPP